jgi:hypothetical protein
MTRSTTARCRARAQFQGVRDKNIEQFKKPGVQVVLHPDSQKTAL